MAKQHLQQLGHYRLLRLIGQGGFAEVYLGEHIHLNTTVAVKLLHTRLAESDVQDFRREAQTVARLVHPHIVRVLDFGVENAVPYLVMDHAPNGSLRQRYPKGSRLPLATVVTLIGQCADALQYAHDQRLIHRDIKPENMLLGARDEVLLSDFGLALVLQSTTHNSTQNIAGTIAYMAPEQIQAHPRPASDQYSLAVIAYEWLSGKRPFEGSYTEVAVKHSITPPPPLRQQVPELSEAVEQVVMHALQKDPKQRFPSVRDFAQALAAAVGGSVQQTLSEQFIPTVVKPVIDQPGPQPPLSAIVTQHTPPSAQISSGQGAPLPSFITPPIQSGPFIPGTSNPPPVQPGHAPYPWSGPQPNAAGAYPPSTPPASPQTGPGSASFHTPTTWMQQPSPPTTDQHAPWMRDIQSTSTRKVSRRATLISGALGLAALGGGLVWWTTHPGTISIPGVGSVDSSLITGPKLTYSNHEDLVWVVSWSPNGQYIASGSFDTTLKIWTAADGKTQLNIRSTNQPRKAQDYPWSLSWSPKNNLLAVSFVYGNIQVLDPKTKQRVAQSTKIENTTSALAWSPDGQYLAITGTASGNDVVHIYAYPSWEIVQTYTGHANNISTLAWSPDGRYIVTGSDDTAIHVWEALTARQKLLYTNHTDRIASVGWSPDSKQVVSSAQDHKVAAWDIENGHVTFTYKGTGGAPMGMATWSPNGKYIAVYDGNARVVLLDATNGQMRRTINTGVVYGISWSPDSTSLVTGCYDHVAKIWSADI